MIDVPIHLRRVMNEDFIALGQDPDPVDYNPLDMPDATTYDTNPQDFEDGYGSGSEGFSGEENDFPEPISHAGGEYGSSRLGGAKIFNVLSDTNGYVAFDLILVALKPHLLP